MLRSRKNCPQTTRSDGGLLARWGYGSGGCAGLRVFFCCRPILLVMRGAGAAWVAIAVLFGSMALCGTALAEVGVPAGTVQAAAANALFEEYAPAPSTPGIVCLVDSGVDANPDTTPILAGSYALSPGTNTEDELAALDPPLPGGHPDGHGTYMAMIAAAPVNGWGMVGVAPTSVRVYNVKALAAGQTTFSFAEYAVAISRCQALSSSMPITVVNLSLGSSTQPSGAELETLENYVESANGHGLSVVAAAGNEGGQVQAPADVQGVLGVGASDANPANVGAMCSFSDRGFGLALLAPGCDGQTGGIEIAFSDTGEPAWASGTSEAAVIVSAADASMRAYSPTLTYSQAENCITSTLTNEGNLDVAAAFEACGLSQIVNEGMAAYKAANPQPTPLTTNSGGSSSSAPHAAPSPSVSSHKAMLVRPRVTVIMFKAHRLTITVADVPQGLRLKVVVQDRNRMGRLVTLAQATTGHATITLRVGAWDRIEARFLAGKLELPSTILTRPTHKGLSSRQGLP
jgi:hypothetical protein